MKNKPNLTSETMKGVRNFFDNKTDHQPTEETYTALTAIAQTLEDMAYCKTIPKIYLSSLDPGSGKTVTITQFVKALTKQSKSSPELNKVGVIICLSRLEEIGKMVDSMALGDSEFACITSKEEHNRRGLGKDKASQARILFTTQQMLESRLNGHPFHEAGDFLFNNVVREVRIWDESFLPGEGIVISEYDFRELSGIAGRCGQTAVSNALLNFSHQIMNSNSGETIEVPNFVNLLECAISQFITDIPEQSEDLRKSMNALFYLSGRRVSVSYDGGPNRGAKAISFRETLPDDLMPLLVTDASGRVRHTYQLMMKQRQNIVELPTARKTYRNLIVSVWNKGGGKNSWEKNSPILVNGIVKTIQDEPDRSWLVVHHRPRKRRHLVIPDLEKTISMRLQTNISVKFVTWGNHAASNDYRECDRIILAGTLFYPPSAHEGTARLCGNFLPGLESPSAYDKKAMVIGESKHNILQAVCRGILRLSKNDDCPPCKVFIIASARSGIRDALSMHNGSDYDPSYIFPYCTVEPWNVMYESSVERLRGNMKTVYEFLRSWSDTSQAGDTMRLIDLREIAHASDPKSFNQSFRSLDMVSALNSIDIDLHQPASRLRGIVKT